MENQNINEHAPLLREDEINSLFKSNHWNKDENSIKKSVADIKKEHNNIYQNEGVRSLSETDAKLTSNHTNTKKHIVKKCFIKKQQCQGNESKPINVRPFLVKVDSVVSFRQNKENEELSDVEPEDKRITVEKNLEKYNRLDRNERDNIVDIFKKANKKTSHVKLLQPLEDHSNCELLTLSLNHMLKVFLTTLPIVVAVCLADFCLSKLPYTNDCEQYPKTSDCTYYNENLVFGVNGIVTLILNNIMITLVISVFITSKKLFVQNLLFVTIPTEVAAVTAFVIMFLLNVKIWYYHIDVFVTEAFFFVTAISCFSNIAKHLEEIRLKNVFIRIMFPCVFGTAGYMFSQVYLFSKFRVSDVTEKYLIRLVYYPLMVEVSLILIEYCCRTFEGGSYTNIHGRAHYIFFVQATLGILGRYLTTISGSLTSVTVISAFHFLKDVFVHRLSWLQCYIAHKVKRLFCFKEGKEDFSVWFYGPHFQEFRACVFNNDFVIEVAAAFIVPIMVVSFQGHKMLFTFDYRSLEHDGNGAIDFKFLLKAEAIQFFFICLTFFVISFIEAKYNKLDLRVVYKSNSSMEIFSRFIIFLWCIFFLLSSETLLPGFENCDKDDICTCKFDINKTQYGCHQNTTIYEGRL